MKKFIITPDINEFELCGQNFSEKYTVYRLKDISENNRAPFIKEKYKDKNDIIDIVKN